MSELYNYLSEDEKKEIATRVFEKSVAKYTEKDIDRCLSNFGYDIVVKAINKNIDDDCEKLIIENTKKVLGDVSSYVVFKKPDAWDRDSSKAYDLLQKCTEENKDILDKKVKEIFSEISLDLIRREISSVIRNVVMDAFGGGGK